MLTGNRLAVWGDPIAHSRSPQLHAAAYAALGTGFSYGRRRVDELGFRTALAGLDDGWRGLSLTMPLKTAAFAAAVTRDIPAQRTGAVNTLLLDDGGPIGFNTDVGGIVRALAEAGHPAPSTVRIVGAGATATSAVAALAETGTPRVSIAARRPEAAAALVASARLWGLIATAEPLTEAVTDDVEVTIATIPGGAALPDGVSLALARRGGTLLDVVYGHWPTALSREWAHHGGSAHSGLGMLLHQGLLQVRLFVTGRVQDALPDEQSVLSAMRAVLVGD